MGSKANHELNLRDEGLIIATEEDKNKCLYTMTTSGSGAKISSKSTDLVEVVSGKKIVLNVNEDSQDDLTKKEQDLEQPYISLNKDQIVIGIGTSKIILGTNKISIQADTIDVEGSNNVNIKTNSMSMESGGSTNIKASASIAVKGASVDINASSAASIKGSITKVG
jgi:hypothetical protein